MDRVVTKVAEQLHSQVRAAGMWYLECHRCQGDALRAQLPTSKGSQIGNLKFQKEVELEPRERVWYGVMETEVCMLQPVGGRSAPSLWTPGFEPQLCLPISCTIVVLLSILFTLEFIHLPHKDSRVLSQNCDIKLNNLCKLLSQCSPWHIINI